MEETVLCYFEDPENLTVVCNGVQYKEEDIIEPSDFLFWLYLILYGALVCFAGESDSVHNLTHSAKHTIATCIQVPSVQSLTRPPTLK